MSECQRFELTLRGHVSGELEEAAREPLLAHCRICEECRRLLELHRELAGLGSSVSLPTEAELDGIQEQVLSEVAGGGNRKGEREKGIGSRFLPRPVRPVVMAASIILAFVLGLVAGHGIPWRAAGGDGREASRLTTALSAEAVSNRDLADVEDSRFTYSNVSFRRLEGGRVALGFDVTTHLELVEPVQSELVREVLAQSLLNPSSTGARLKAMSLVGGALDPKLREAITFSLRHDESLAVRLEGLAILSGQLDDPAVQSAVMAALGDDEAVQVRLLALESLAAHHVDHDRIRDAIRERRGRAPGDEALMVRLAEYEK